jgi:hypothetical protein
MDFVEWTCFAARAGSVGGASTAAGAEVGGAVAAGAAAAEGAVAVVAGGAAAAGDAAVGAVAECAGAAAWSTIGVGRARGVDELVATPGHPRLENGIRGHDLQTNALATVKPPNTTSIPRTRQALLFGLLSLSGAKSSDASTLPAHMLMSRGGGSRPRRG